MTLDAIVLWCASALIALLSYVTIVQPDEAAVQLHESNQAMLASRIERTESILQSEPNLEATRRRIMREVTHAAAQGRESDAMTFLFHTLAQETKREHIAFFAFTPASTEAPVPAETPATPEASRGTRAQTQSPSLTSRDISFTVRGRFRSLLDFLSNVSLDDPLVEIQNLNIQAQTDPAAQSTVASMTPAEVANSSTTGSSYHATTDLQVEITARLYRISAHVFDKPLQRHERIHQTNVITNTL